MLVGGRAPLALRQRIAQPLIRAGVTAEAISSGPLAGQHPQNIVNRLSARGLQLEMSPRVRSDAQVRATIVRLVGQELVNELTRQP